MWELTLTVLCCFPSFHSSKTTGGEEYEVETALTPLESRILSLAQQQEVRMLSRWKGEEENRWWGLSFADASENGA